MDNRTTWLPNHVLDHLLADSGRHGLLRLAILWYSYADARGTMKHRAGRVSGVTNFGTKTVSRYAKRLADELWEFGVRKKRMDVSGLKFDRRKGGYTRIPIHPDAVASMQSTCLAVLFALHRNGDWDDEHKVTFSKVRQEILATKLGITSRGVRKAVERLALYYGVTTVNRECVGGARKNIYMTHRAGLMQVGRDSKGDLTFRYLVPDVPVAGDLTFRYPSEAQSSLDRMVEPPNEDPEASAPLPIERNQQEISNSTLQEIAARTLSSKPRSLPSARRMVEDAREWVQGETGVVDGDPSPSAERVLGLYLLVYQQQKGFPLRVKSLTAALAAIRDKVQEYEGDWSAVVALAANVHQPWANYKGKVDPAFVFGDDFDKALDATSRAIDNAKRDGDIANWRDQKETRDKERKPLRPGFGLRTNDGTGWR